MDQVIMSAKGSNGVLELLQNKIRIKRSKGLNTLILQGLKGDKEIFINQISSIQFKNAGFTVGYIQFAFIGGQETKAGVFDAVKDENTVTFTKRQQGEFEAIKHAIEEKLFAKNDTPKESASPGYDDLEKLAELRDKGIITQEDFNAKKKQLLGI